MRQLIAILLAILLPLATFSALAADRVMVEQLDVYASPDINSKIIGHFKKGDTPVLTDDGKDMMCGVEYNGTTGYVIEFGLFNDQYEPQSTQYYEANVDLIKSRLQRGETSYDFQLIEDKWENDNQETWAPTEDEEPWTGPRQYGFEPWAMRAFVICSFIALLCVFFFKRWAVGLMIALAIAQLLYFSFTPDPWYFAYYKYVDGEQSRRMANLTWPIITVLLQIFAVMRLRSSASKSRFFTCLSLFIAGYIVAICRYGISDMAVQIMHSVVELIFALIGLCVAGIVIYSITKGADDAPSRKARDNTPNYRRCYNCAYFQTHGQCRLDGKLVNSDDVCGSFTQN